MFGLQRYFVDYLLKNLGLTLNFIKEGISSKDILKAATDCTAVTGINWRDTRFSCFGQHLLFICVKAFLISVTSEVELIKFLIKTLGLFIANASI